MHLPKDSLEDISYLLRIPQRKPFGTMEGNVKKALQVMLDFTPKLLMHNIQEIYLYCLCLESAIDIVMHYLCHNKCEPRTWL